MKHSIDDQNAKPTREAPRRVSYHIQGKIERSTRFCVDYRRLNRVTNNDAYPLPRIDDSLNQLSRAKWFNTFDICSGYWQVKVEEKDGPKLHLQHKKDFSVRNIIPFGLCNAPVTLER